MAIPRPAPVVPIPSPEALGQRAGIPYSRFAQSANVQDYNAAYNAAINKDLSSKLDNFIKLLTNIPVEKTFLYESLIQDGLPEDQARQQAKQQIAQLRDYAYLQRRQADAMVEDVKTGLTADKFIQRAINSGARLWYWYAYAAGGQNPFREGTKEYEKFQKEHPDIKAQNLQQIMQELSFDAYHTPTTALDWFATTTADNLVNMGTSVLGGAMYAVPVVGPAIAAGIMSATVAAPSFFETYSDLVANKVPLNVAFNAAALNAIGQTVVEYGAAAIPVGIGKAILPKSVSSAMLGTVSKPERMAKLIGINWGKTPMQQVKAIGRAAAADAATYETAVALRNAFTSPTMLAKIGELTKETITSGLAGGWEEILQEGLDIATREIASSVSGAESMLPRDENGKVDVNAIRQRMIDAFIGGMVGEGTLGGATAFVNTVSHMPEYRDSKRLRQLYDSLYSQMRKTSVSGNEILSSAGKSVQQQGVADNEQYTLDNFSPEAADFILRRTIAKMLAKEQEPDKLDPDYRRKALAESMAELLSKPDLQALLEYTQAEITFRAPEYFAVKINGQEFGVINAGGKLGKEHARFVPNPQKPGDIFVSQEVWNDLVKRGLDKNVIVISSYSGNTLGHELFHAAFEALPADQQRELLARANIERVQAHMQTGLDEQTARKEALAEQFADYSRRQQYAARDAGLLRRAWKKVVPDKAAGPMDELFAQLHQELSKSVPFETAGEQENVFGTLGYYLQQITEELKDSERQQLRDLLTRIQDKDQADQAVEELFNLLGEVSSRAKDKFKNNQTVLSQKLDSVKWLRDMVQNYRDLIQTQDAEELLDTLLQPAAQPSSPAGAAQAQPDQAQVSQKPLGLPFNLEPVEYKHADDAILSYSALEGTETTATIRQSEAIEAGKVSLIASPSDKAYAPGDRVVFKNTARGFEVTEMQTVQTNRQTLQQKLEELSRQTGLTVPELRKMVDKKGRIYLYKVRPIQPGEAATRARVLPGSPTEGQFRDRIIKIVTSDETVPDGAQEVRQIDANTNVRKVYQLLTDIPQGQAVLISRPAAELLDAMKNRVVTIEKDGQKIKVKLKQTEAFAALASPLGTFLGGVNVYYVPPSGQAKAPAADYAVGMFYNLSAGVSTLLTQSQKSALPSARKLDANDLKTAGVIVNAALTDLAEKHQVSAEALRLPLANSEDYDALLNAVHAIINSEMTVLFAGPSDNALSGTYALLGHIANMFHKPFYLYNTRTLNWYQLTPNGFVLMNSQPNLRKTMAILGTTARAGEAVKTAIKEWITQSPSSRLHLTPDQTYEKERLAYEKALEGLPLDKQREKLEQYAQELRQEIDQAVNRIVNNILNEQTKRGVNSITAQKTADLVRRQLLRRIGQFINLPANMRPLVEPKFNLLSRRLARQYNTPMTADLLYLMHRLAAIADVYKTRPAFFVDAQAVFDQLMSLGTAKFAKKLQTANPLLARLRAIVDSIDPVLYQSLRARMEEQFYRIAYLLDTPIFGQDQSMPISTLDSVADALKDVMIEMDKVIPDDIVQLKAAGASDEELVAFSAAMQSANILREKLAARERLDLEWDQIAAKMSELEEGDADLDTALQFLGQDARDEWKTILTSLHDIYTRLFGDKDKPGATEVSFNRARRAVYALTMLAGLDPSGLAYMHSPEYAGEKKIYIKAIEHELPQFLRGLLKWMAYSRIKIGQGGYSRAELLETALDKLQTMLAKLAPEIENLDEKTKQFVSEIKERITTQERSDQLAAYARQINTPEKIIQRLIKTGVLRKVNSQRYQAALDALKDADLTNPIQTAVKLSSALNIPADELKANLPKIKSALDLTSSVQGLVELAYQIMELDLTAKNLMPQELRDQVKAFLDEYAKTGEINKKLSIQIFRLMQNQQVAAKAQAAANLAASYPLAETLLTTPTETEASKAAKAVARRLGITVENQITPAVWSQIIARIDGLLSLFFDSTEDIPTERAHQLIRAADTVLAVRDFLLASRKLNKFERKVLSSPIMTGVQNESVQTLRKAAQDIGAQKTAKLLNAKRVFLQWRILRGKLRLVSEDQVYRAAMNLLAGSHANGLYTAKLGGFDITMMPVSYKLPFAPKLGIAGWQAPQYNPLQALADWIANRFNLPHDKQEDLASFFEQAELSDQDKKDLNMPDEAEENSAEMNTDQDDEASGLDVTDAQTLLEKAPLSAEGVAAWVARRMLAELRTLYEPLFQYQEKVPGNMLVRILLNALQYSAYSPDQVLQAARQDFQQYLAVIFNQALSEALQARQSALDAVPSLDETLVNDIALSQDIKRQIVQQVSAGGMDKDDFLYAMDQLNLLSASFIGDKTGKIKTAETIAQEAAAFDKAMASLVKATRVMNLMQMYLRGMASGEMTESLFASKSERFQRLLTEEIEAVLNATTRYGWTHTAFQAALHELGKGGFVVLRSAMRTALEMAYSGSVSDIQKEAVRKAKEYLAEQERKEQQKAQEEAEKKVIRKDIPYGKQTISSELLDSLEDWQLDLIEQHYTVFESELNRLKAENPNPEKLDQHLAQLYTGVMHNIEGLGTVQERRLDYVRYLAALSYKLSKFSEFNIRVGRKGEFETPEETQKKYKKYIGSLKAYLTETAKQKSAEQSGGMPYSAPQDSQEPKHYAQKIESQTAAVLAGTQAYQADLIKDLLFGQRDTQLTEWYWKINELADDLNQIIGLKRPERLRDVAKAFYQTLRGKGELSAQKVDQAYRIGLSMRFAAEAMSEPQRTAKEALDAYRSGLQTALERLEQIEKPTAHQKFVKREYQRYLDALDLAEQIVDNAAPLAQKLRSFLDGRYKALIDQAWQEINPEEISERPLPKVKYWVPRIFMSDIDTEDLDDASQGSGLPLFAARFLERQAKLEAHFANLEIFAQPDIVTALDAGIAQMIHAKANRQFIRESLESGFFRTDPAPGFVRLNPNAISLTEWVVASRSGRSIRVFRSRQDAIEHLSSLSGRGKMSRRQKPLYAPAEWAGYFNRISSPSTLRGNALTKALLATNAKLKMFRLAWSLFHRRALYWSAVLAGAFNDLGMEDLSVFGKLKTHLSWEKRRELVQKLVQERAPEIYGLIYHGLTPLKTQEFGDTNLQFLTSIDKTLLTMPKIGDFAAHVSRLTRAFQNELFGTFGNAMKMAAAYAELQRELKKYGEKIAAEKAQSARIGRLSAAAKAYFAQYAGNPEKIQAAQQAQGGMWQYYSATEEQILRSVAGLANADFGGLHLGRLGVSKTMADAARLLLLGPDWTLSNLQTVLKIIPYKSSGGTGANAYIGNDALERALYSHLWLRILGRGALITFALNLLLSGLDDQSFWQRLRTAWKLGKFRIIQVDYTPLAQMFGGDAANRYYSNLFGHFADPLKWSVEPFNSLVNKGSIIAKPMLTAVKGVDYRGERYTPVWSIPFKGLTQPSAKSGPVTLFEMPSFAISAMAETFTPFAVNELLKPITSGVSPFAALIAMLGMPTQTAFRGNIIARIPYRK